MHNKLMLEIIKWFLIAIGCLVCTFTANATTIQGMYFSVNNSAAGNFMWSSPQTGSCSGPSCAEVGGGFVYVPPDFINTAEENKRAMAEFNLTGLGYMGSAVLSFNVFSSDGYYIQGCCVNADVVAYQGDNVASLSDWSAASTATIGSFNVGWFECATVYCTGSTISFDVTAAYNYALLHGWTALGIRLQDPNVSIYQASQFDNFLLTTSAVPLPAAGWLFASACLGMLGVAARRRRRACF